MPAKHRAVIVVELALDNPDQIAEALTHMHPQSIPAFAGAVRVAVGDVADSLIAWLDEDTGQEQITKRPAPIDPWQAPLAGNIEVRNPYGCTHTCDAPSCQMQGRA
jgi:hypothetical protein